VQNKSQNQNPNQTPDQNQQNQTQAKPNQPNPNTQDRDQMTPIPEEQRRASRPSQQTDRNESGRPGGGVGRKDTPGRTGVYPVSADEGASGSAKVQGEQAFGQGDRGAAGYQDSGGSAIIPPDELGKTDKEVI
jgi:hypothetical protein